MRSYHSWTVLLLCACFHHVSRIIICSIQVLQWWGINLRCISYNKRSAISFVILIPASMKCITCTVNVTLNTLSCTWVLRGYFSECHSAHTQPPLGCISYTINLLIFTAICFIKKKKTQYILTFMALCSRILFVTFNKTLPVSILWVSF